MEKVAKLIKQLLENEILYSRKIILILKSYMNFHYFLFFFLVKQQVKLLIQIDHCRFSYFLKLRIFLSFILS